MDISNNPPVPDELPDRRTLSPGAMKPLVRTDARVITERLTQLFPQCHPTLDDFPSGAFMIDLVIGGKVFVVESVGSDKFGLSIQETAVFGWEGVDQLFETIEGLEQRIGDLLAANIRKDH